MLNEQFQKMKKTQQEQINETIGEALEGLSDALKLTSASRDMLMKLLQFEGNRIDKLENKIDLLMANRTEVVTTPNEEIHFEDFHFEVETADKLDEMNWNKATTFNAYDNDGWRLPTIDELRLMYLCKDRLGMREERYWSSSENFNNNARYVYFGNGSTSSSNEYGSLRVRLVRTIDE